MLTDSVLFSGSSGEGNTAVHTSMLARAKKHFIIIVQLNFFNAGIVPKWRVLLYSSCSCIVCTMMFT